VKDINYYQLQNDLDKFFYLRKLRIIFDQPVSTTLATRLLPSIPSIFTTPLSLEVSSDSKKSFEKAVERCKRKDIVLKSNQMTIDNTRLEKGHLHH
jgi:hypothetical protein